MENLFGPLIASAILIGIRYALRFIGYAGAATAHTAGKLKKVYKEAAGEDDEEASLEIRTRAVVRRKKPTE